MSILEASTITFGYTTPLLRDLSLSLQPGDMLALVGPNGCGKTTLLKTLSGLLSPERGHVMLNMTSLDKMSTRDIAQQLAAVEQHIPTDFAFTVSHIVSLGRLPHRKRWQPLTSRDQDVIQHAMAQTGIAQMANRTIHQLSSGEKQRVWLAMALAQEPRVLLLDEPTSHLDLPYQLHMLTLLHQLSQQGLAIVLSIHELQMIHAFANRIALMKQGKILHTGHPQDTLTESHLEETFGIPMHVIHDPDTHDILAIVPKRPNNVSKSAK